MKKVLSMLLLFLILVSSVVFADVVIYRTEKENFVDRMTSINITSMIMMGIFALIIVFTIVFIVQKKRETSISKKNFTKLLFVVLFIISIILFEGSFYVSAPVRYESTGHGSHMDKILFNDQYEQYAGKSNRLQIRALLEMVEKNNSLESTDYKISVTATFIDEDGTSFVSKDIDSIIQKLYEPKKFVYTYDISFSYGSDGRINSCEIIGKKK